MPKPGTAIPLEVMARQTPPDINLSEQNADEIAMLARALAQNAAASTLIIRPEGDVDRRPYTDLPPAQRAAMRAAVIRVVQALAMLGWIESPS